MENIGKLKIRGFMKMTLLDFPGKVACTVFTGGCNLRCPFCHNADLVRTPSGEDLYDEVMQYLLRRKGIIDGVCISGGEPLLRPCLESFISEIKQLGYMIKLDTNGSLPSQLRALVEKGLVDYVAMDIKSSPQGYMLATGSEIPFEVFQESIGILRNSGIDYEFRTTAVKGIHTIEDFKEISKILLPDEKYFIQRFVDSGNLLGSCQMTAFSKDETAEIISTLSQRLNRVEARG